MHQDALSEAYARLEDTGPEWGESQLTNHGPMAVEVMVRRGYATTVNGWLDRYSARLEQLPPPRSRITDSDWRDALGDGRRLGDWTAYFEQQLSEQPWRDVLQQWWPRLRPGILAGTTHGVIRVGHVVRALLSGSSDSTTVTELGRGLAFWAARMQPLPISGAPSGRLDPGAALDHVPRVPMQDGPVAARLAQLPELPRWRIAVAALSPPPSRKDVPERLQQLIDAALVRYLSHGYAAPVLLVHTATAPNAVLHCLPALPAEEWRPSFDAVWSATAFVYSGWAPAKPRPPVPLPKTPSGPDAAADVIDRSIRHGDEHVIKFTDTAVEAFQRTGDPGTLAVAMRVATLIPRADR
jgi:hypothetical protein